MTKHPNRGGIRAETQQTKEQFRPEIRRARYQRLTIYEVEEAELQLLERGAPDSVLLTIAIALFTLAITLTITLFTATFASSAIHTALISLTVVGYVSGSILTLMWSRTKSAVSQCVTGIRDRLPPEWVLDSSADDRTSDFAAQHAAAADANDRRTPPSKC